MSASEENTKIDAIDKEKQIIKKFGRFYCPEREIHDNPVLLFTRAVIFPYLERIGGVFEVRRPEKYGGDISFSKYNELETAFSTGDVHPADLKKTVGGYLVDILAPVRKRFDQAADLLANAYPNDS